MRDQRDRHLLDDFHAFVQEHDRCGDLDSAVEGDRVWMTWHVRRDDQPLGSRRLTRLLVRVAAVVHVLAVGYTPA